MARILLIDDEGLVLSVLHGMLAQFGHTVIEARNGKEGLRLFEEVGADLIITDLVMPEKEGLEVIMELRKKQLSVKIIAISGEGRPHTADYLHAATLLGAAKVLEKPFTTEDLMAAVNELLL